MSKSLHSPPCHAFAHARLNAAACHKSDEGEGASPFVVGRVLILANNGFRPLVANFPLSVDIVYTLFPRPCGHAKKSFSPLSLSQSQSESLLFPIPTKRRSPPLLEDGGLACLLIRDILQTSSAPPNQAHISFLLPPLSPLSLPQRQQNDAREIWLHLGRRLSHSP